MDIRVNMKESLWDHERSLWTLVLVDVIGGQRSLETGGTSGADATLKGHWSIHIICGRDWEAGRLTQKLGSG